MTRREEILDRVYDHATDKEIPIVLKNDNYLLVQSINTCYNTDIIRYKRLLKLMTSNKISDLNIVFVIFIDINTDRDNVIDIVNITYDVIGKNEKIYFIIPQKHLHVVF